VAAAALSSGTWELEGLSGGAEVERAFLAFRPDGKVLATAYDKELELWDVDYGTQLAIPQVPDKPKGEWLQLHFDVGGSLLAAIGDDTDREYMAGGERVRYFGRS